MKRRQNSIKSHSNAVPDQNKKFSLCRIFLQLLTSILCGVIFGVALEKGRVFEPQIIRDQMLCNRFLMLKMFLSASAMSMFTLGVLSMIPGLQSFNQASRAFTVGFKNKGMLTSVLGGCVLGMGMTISGACPGMVFVQFGTRVPNSEGTLLGGFCGVLLYGIFETTISRVMQPQKAIRKHFLCEHLGTPHFMLAIPGAAILSIVVFWVEMYSPWKTEISSSNDERTGILSSYAWPPYVAGTIIGFLQVPEVLVNKDTLGSSGSYCTIVSQLFVSPHKGSFPYLEKFRSGIHNWWQVFYVGSAILGAWISSNASGSGGSVAGVSLASGFFGGILMLFGARLAAGCTSGHGLSGMGLLAVLSLVAVPSIFAGAIFTASIMKDAKLL